MVTEGRVLIVFWVVIVLSNILPNRMWVSLRIMCICSWWSWWTTWCLQMVSYLWHACTHAWPYGWSNIQDVSFIIKDINHLHSLLMFQLQTTQKVSVFVLVQGTYNLTQSALPPPECKLWTFDHIHHLLMIIAGFVYIRLWVGIFLNLITVVQTASQWHEQVDVSFISVQSPD